MHGRMRDVESPRVPCELRAVCRGRLSDSEKARKALGVGVNITFTEILGRD